MANKVIASGITAGEIHIKQKGPGNKKVQMTIPGHFNLHLLGNYRIKEYS